MEIVNKIVFLLVRNFTYLGNIFPQAMVCLYLCLLEFSSGFYVTGLWGWSYFLNSVIKNFAKKPRPDKSGHKIQVGGYSFPSGHAMTSFAIYFSTVKYFHPSELWTYILYALPFALGLSRIYLGVHYWRDIIGGWLIAYVYLYLFEGFLNHMHGYFYDTAEDLFDHIAGFIIHYLKF